MKGKIDLKCDVGVFENYLDFIVKKFDFCLILGGDGIILDVLIYVWESEVFILGINFGCLGFLVSIEKIKIMEVI